jgi:hypothetical protein
MVIVEDGSNNYDAYCLDLSPQSRIEYSVFPQYSQISTKLEANKIP